MNRAPSRRYRLSFSGVTPCFREGELSSSFLSQYQHGITLIQSKLVVLNQNKPLIESLWTERVKMRVTIMDSNEHDRVYGLDAWGCLKKYLQK